MESILAYLVNLMYAMVTTVLKTLAHNGWVLAISIATAVALKTYVNTEKLGRFLTGKARVSIFLSVAVGAFTPFCACGTMAVIVGMLTTFMKRKALALYVGLILLGGMAAGTLYDLALRLL